MPAGKARLNTLATSARTGELLPLSPREKDRLTPFPFCNSSGGIIGSMLNGRIKVDNTLDERLGILEEKMLPEIRTDLFGKNENRRFTSVSWRRGGVKVIVIG